MDQLSVRKRFAAWLLCGLALCVSPGAQPGSTAPATYGLQRASINLTLEGEMLVAGAADQLLIEPSKRALEPDNEPLDVTVEPAVTEAPELLVEPTLAAAQSREFERRMYLGVGLGISRLEPDASGVPGARVTDSEGTGGQLMLGADLLPLMSLELHASDLGAAQLEPQGEIGYRTYGVSGLFYVGGSRGNHNRDGLSGFGRLGAGSLQNKATGQVRLQQDNEWQVLFGAGLEYSHGRSGLAARAELISFQEDARYAQVSLLYRVGGRKSRTGGLAVTIPNGPTPDSDLIESSAPAPGAPVPAAAAMATRLPDSDRDGVADLADGCPDTASGKLVNPFGCSLPPGLLEGLQFRVGSAELTDESVNVLVGAADFLRAWPDARFRLSAHTDNQGSAEYNMSLARERALWVLRFLINAGVSPDQLQARAFGESQPIAPNTTVEGRQANRRIELEVLSGN